MVRSFTLPRVILLIFLAAQQMSRMTDSRNIPKQGILSRHTDDWCLLFSRWSYHSCDLLWLWRHFCPWGFLCSFAELCALQVLQRAVQGGSSHRGAAFPSATGGGQMGLSQQVSRTPWDLCQFSAKVPVSSCEDLRWPGTAPSASWCHHLAPTQQFVQGGACPRFSRLSQWYKQGRMFSSEMDFCPKLCWLSGCSGWRGVCRGYSQGGWMGTCMKAGELLVLYQPRQAVYTSSYVDVCIKAYK